MLRGVPLTRLGWADPAGLKRGSVKRIRGASSAEPVGPTQPPDETLGLSLWSADENLDLRIGQVRSPHVQAEASGKSNQDG